MKRLPRFLTAAVLLAAGFVTLTAFGGHAWWHHGELTPEKAEHIATMMTDRMLDDVTATDIQRTQINAIKEQAVRDVVAFAQAHKGVRDTMLQEWSSEKPDAKAVHALIDQRIEALRALAHKAADDALEIHDILHPDQRAILTDHIQRHIGGEETK